MRSGNRVIVVILATAFVAGSAFGQGWKALPIFGTNSGVTPTDIPFAFQDPSGLWRVGVNERDARGFSQAEFLELLEEGSTGSSYQFRGTGARPFGHLDVLAQGTQTFIGGYISSPPNYQTSLVPSPWTAAPAPGAWTAGFQASSFGQLSNGLFGSIDVVSGGVFKPAFFDNGVITVLPSGGIGSFAAASTERWAGFNTLFDDGGGSYHYSPEAYFKNLTDKHLNFRFSSFANSQLGKSRGKTTVGSGGSIDGSLNYHALVPCVWQDDGSTNAQTSDATELQTSGSGGIAIELNGAGAIVGQDYNKGASLWTPNGDGTYQLLDLNLTLAPGSGWHLTKATYISDSGDIFGVGEFQGQSRAFHLVPLPEPASILVLGVGALGVVRRRHSSTKLKQPA